MFCLYFILSLYVVTYCQDTSANQEQSKYVPDPVLCFKKGMGKGMLYDNKCFVAFNDHEVSYTDGVAVCESHGGHLANIYSQTHMDDVMKYIRYNKLAETNLWKKANEFIPSEWYRLGMKYDPKANKLTLRDGSDAPAGLKWKRGYPWTVEKLGEYVAGGSTNVILLVQIRQCGTNQYLINIHPSHPAYVLCEIEW